MNDYNVNGGLPIGIDPIARAMAGKGGGGGGGYSEHKLIYDGNRIAFNGEPQTFSQVKESCESPSEFVYLVYEDRLYIPQYVSDTSIYFTCTYQTNTMGVQTRKITFASSGTIRVDNIELAPKTYVDEAIGNAIGGEY